MKNVLLIGDSIRMGYDKAVKTVKKHGFEVNDLHALSMTLPDEYLSDAVHYYTPKAAEAFLKQVLSVLEAALGAE